MSARLANEETRIVVDEVAITLRPTLRAAARLERRWGGFDAILHGITTGSLSIMSDVLSECATDPNSLRFILTDMRRIGLGAILERLKLPLVAHVLALAGLDPDDLTGKRERRRAAAEISFAEHHTRLYRLATGWLGWTPDAAWNATPAEITEAYAGHVEMLKAIHGVADKASKPEGSVGDKVRAFFGARGTTKVSA